MWNEFDYLSRLKVKVLVCFFVEKRFSRSRFPEVDIDECGMGGWESYLQELKVMVHKKIHTHVDDDI